MLYALAASLNIKIKVSSKHKLKPFELVMIRGVPEGDINGCSFIYDTLLV